MVLRILPDSEHINKNGSKSVRRESQQINNHKKQTPRTNKY